MEDLEMEQKHCDSIYSFIINRANRFSKNKYSDFLFDLSELKLEDEKDLTRFNFFKNFFTIMCFYNNNKCYYKGLDGDSPFMSKFFTPIAEALDDSSLLEFDMSYGDEYAFKMGLPKPLEGINYDVIKRMGEIYEWGK